MYMNSASFESAMFLYRYGTNVLTRFVDEEMGSSNKDGKYLVLSKTSITIVNIFRLI